MWRFLYSVILASCCGMVTAADLPDALVSTEWLAEHLTDPDVSVLEVSVIPEQFKQGHISGAGNLNWHTDLVDPVRRDLVSAERLQQLLQQAGVSNDSTIILYGDNNNWFAAWGVWVLNYYGIERVKLLDGGRVKWEMEGRPLSRDIAAPAAGNIVITGSNQSIRARLKDVVAAAEQTAQDQLVDIRSPQEYRGEIIAPPGVNELAMRAGHIPGAVNIPWSALVNKNGTFKSAEELRQLYAAVGIDGSRPVITYCRIGERSSHSWFALSKLLGYQVRNYDGSWTEYGNAVGVPISNPSGSVWQGL